MGKAVEIERLFAADHLDGDHGGAVSLIEQLDGAQQGDAAHLVEERLREGAAMLGDGLGPGAVVERHRVGDGAVEVEEVSGVRAGRERECGGH